MGNWLLDGTWSPGQVRHSDFKNKLKRENDHKVQKKKKKWRTVKWLKHEQEVTPEAFTNSETWMIK